ncbi:MAG: TetR/AcrR family transcriptional regulator, partial [Christensenellales bacterium]
MYQLVERANKTSLFVRDCISTALFELMEKKDFHKIKITEIIERAGVSRMGFYRNFKSKEDVVEQFIYEKFVET